MVPRCQTQKHHSTVPRFYVDCMDQKAASKVLTLVPETVSNALSTLVSRYPNLGRVQKPLSIVLPLWYLILASRQQDGHEYQHCGLHGHGQTQTKATSFSLIIIIIIIMSVFLERFSM